MKTQEIINKEMDLAWQFVTGTHVSVFLTGKAGTGKTTFLHRLREETPKRMVVLAPTGVAAINAKGQTIHSFFQLPLGPNVPGQKTERHGSFKMSEEKKNLIRTLDLLVIDEVSMVRCDLLDAVDEELRKYKNRFLPFGGVQLLLIGDLQQLAPVTKEDEWRLLESHYDTPYFFSSKALQQLQYVTIELQHIYRQQDREFIDILAKIRENRVDDEVLKALNERYIENFQTNDGEGWIRLTTHNKSAKDYNELKLNKLLDTEERVFRAQIERNFPENNYPAEEELVLKVGAQVMFIKNDPSGAREYYNGKIGVVEDFDDEGVSVYCQEDRSHVLVTPVLWENVKYVLNEETSDIKEVVEGTFRQYPLRLAWAITVHKSQGLTFDHAVLDINASFAHGQVYVALSRCRTLDGLVLSHPLDRHSVITDQTVSLYINNGLAQTKMAEENLPAMKFQYFYSLINEMFDFRALVQSLAYLTRVVDEHLYRQYPEFLRLLKEKQTVLDTEIQKVAVKFSHQYASIMQTSSDYLHDELLQTRLQAAIGYFAPKLKECMNPVVLNAKIKLENKQVSKQYNGALDTVIQDYKLKKGVFNRLKDKEFTVQNYLTAKAQSVLDKLEIEKPSPVKKVKEKVKEVVRKTKVDTKQMSLDMFLNGLTVNEIARARNLKPQTIGGHIAHFVGTGVLDIDDLVSPILQDEIQSAIYECEGSYTLSQIKEMVPDASYDDIRFVIASM